MSEVTKCSACDHAVSTKAASCPHCGHPLGQQTVVPNKLLKVNGAWERFLAACLIFLFSSLSLLLLYAVVEESSSSSIFYGILFIVFPSLLMLTLFVFLVRKSNNLKLSMLKEQFFKRKLLTVGLFVVLLVLTLAGRSGLNLYLKRKSKCEGFTLLQRVNHKTLEDEKFQLNILLERSKDIIPVCEKISHSRKIKDIREWQTSIRNKMIHISWKIQERQNLIRQQNILMHKKKVLMQKKKAVEDFSINVKRKKAELNLAAKYRRKKLYRDAENLLTDIENFLEFLRGTSVENSKEWKSLYRKFKKEEKRLQPYLDWLEKKEKRKRELQKAKEEKRLALQRAMENKKREDSVQRGDKPLVHFWDGSVPVVERTLKQMLKDPDSYKHMATAEPYAYGPCWLVRTKYRAKNSFGGYVVEEKTFCVNRHGVLLLK